MKEKVPKIVQEGDLSTVVCVASERASWETDQRHIQVPIEDAPRFTAFTRARRL
jgi:hypothetical protein